MNRIDEIKEVRESVKRIKLMSGMSGVIDLIEDAANTLEWYINNEMGGSEKEICIAALRALLDGYRAAVKDICIVAACDVCKHYDPDENSCAKPLKDIEKCFAWRGPEPGGEEA